MKLFTLCLFVLQSLTLAAQQPSQAVIDRHALILPDTLIQRTLGSLFPANKPSLGFAPQEMLLFNPDAYLLRSVSLLFADVATVPRYSATMSGNVYATKDLAALSRIAYGVTDISAGRMILVELDSNRKPYAEPEALPPHIRILLARIIDATEETQPWLRMAFADTVFKECWLPENRTGADHRANALSVVRALWTEERQGQLVSKNPYALRILQNVDRKYLAFASSLFLTHIDKALAEFALAHSAYKTAYPVGKWKVSTKWGDIRIYGSGDDTYDADCFVLLDLGGNDTHLGKSASACSPFLPISVSIDIAGNDVYDAHADTAAIASALFGIAVLADLGGNDSYKAASNSIASSWWGTSVLMDASGDDMYTLDSTYGIAAATVGVAVLDDRAGNDSYTCAAEGESFAQTLGASILTDRAGNDSYVARLDGAISEMYLGQSVSRAQGAAFGRRADLGDGHSLSGGVALLFDIEGNDSYLSGAWAQGCGYWWAAGFLEDWAGNDTYTNGKYSLGAGAHFAIGCITDVAGDDLYNVGNTKAVNQYHGHARDGSIGIAIDGAGNDKYLFKINCGGSADLCSIGLFFDRQGADEYVADYTFTGNVLDWANTPPMGTSTVYTAQYSFRDNLFSAGIFYDAQGKDIYTWKSSADAISAKRTGNSTFTPLKRTPISVGLFWDK